jgi:hypothetical protein
VVRTLAVELDRRLVDRLLLDKLPVLQLPADDRRHGGIARPRVAVRQVDPAVGRVVRVNTDVEQAALSLRRHRGHAADRRLEKLAVLDDAKPPGLLGHEQSPVRQRLHGPDHVQTDRQALELEGVELALDDAIRVGFGEGRLLARELGALFANVNDHRADFLLGQGVGHRRHAGGQVSFLDRLRDAGVVAAPLPLAV